MNNSETPTGANGNNEYKVSFVEADFMEDWDFEVHTAYIGVEEKIILTKKEETLVKSNELEEIQKGLTTKTGSAELGKVKRKAEQCKKLEQQKYVAGKTQKTSEDEVR